MGKFVIVLISFGHPFSSALLQTFFHRPFIVQVMKKSQVIVDGAVQQCKDEATIQVCSHEMHLLLRSMDVDIWG